MRELRPHQREAVDNLANGKILCGDVGVGKSMTAMAYYMKREAPKDVYVITTAKKRDSMDWQDEAIRYGVYTSKDATTQGVLTVDSWNNISKYVEVEGAFFLFDEQRLVGSGAWTKSFIKIARANNWLLLTATPGDTWLDYVAVFLANGFYKNRTQFIREHVVYNTYNKKFPKVDHYIGEPRLRRQRDSLLVTMDYERHTVRKCTDVWVDYDKDLFKRVVKDRWNVYQDRPLRDVAEMFSAMRRVANSDPTRLSAVRDLMEKHPRLIVFYNFDYELNLLRSLVSGSPEERSEQPSSPTGTRSSSTTTTDVRRGVPGLLREYESTTTTERTESWLAETLVDTIFSEEGSSDPQASSVSAVTSRHSSSTPSSRDVHTSINPRTSSGVDLESRKSPIVLSTSLTSPATESQEDTSTTPQTSRSSTREEHTPSHVIAEWNGHKHEPIPVESDRWVYLVQYVAGSEGWNCILTNVVVFYSLTYSYKNWHQAHGRIDRLNTPYTNLFYYYIRGRSPIDLAVWASLSHKKSFNEASFHRYQTKSL